MIVDGHIKSDSKTKEGVEKGARELKGRFPMLQIKVYDAEAKRSEEIALVLLRHEFRRLFDAASAPQHGQRGKVLTSARISRRRMVAIEFGM